MEIPAPTEADVFCLAEKLHGSADAARRFVIRAKEEVLAKGCLAAVRHVDGSSGPQLEATCTGSSPGALYSVRASFAAGSGAAQASSGCPEFSCTCPYAASGDPGQRFPCKHVLALLLWRTSATEQPIRYQDEAPGSAAGPGGAGAAAEPSVHHSRTGCTGRADEEEATQLSEGYAVSRAAASSLLEAADGPGRSRGPQGEARGASGPGGCDGGSSSRSTAAQEATEGGHHAAASRGGNKRRLPPSWSAKTKPQEKKQQPGGKAEAELTEGIDKDTGAGGSISGNHGTGTAALMGEGTTTEEGTPSRSREVHRPPINAAVGPGGAAPRANGSSSGPPRQQQQQGSTPLLRAPHPGRPKAKKSIRGGCGALWLATKTEVADCRDEDLVEACRAALQKQKQQQQQQRRNAQERRPQQTSGGGRLPPTAAQRDSNDGSSSRRRNIPSASVPEIPREEEEASSVVHAAERSSTGNHQQQRRREEPGQHQQDAERHCRQDEPRQQQQQQQQRMPCKAASQSSRRPSAAAPPRPPDRPSGANAVQALLSSLMGDDDDEADDKEAVAVGGGSEQTGGRGGGSTIVSGDVRRQSSERPSSIRTELDRLI